MSPLKHRVIRDSDVREVRQLVKEITIRARPEAIKTGVWLHIDNAEKYVRTQALAGLSVSIVLALLVPVFPGPPLRETAFLVATLTLLLGIAFCMFITVNGLPLINTLRKTPFAVLLSTIGDAIALDQPLVNQLMGCDRYAIEYVLTEYRHGCMAFEKRGSMMSGQLEKIGLFPALGTFAFAATTVWQNASTWVLELLFVIPAFYFMIFMGYGLRQEMERTIALLEYSLAVLDRDDRESE